MWIRSIAIVLPLLVAGVCGAHGQSNKVAETGIQGRVMVSPIRPGPVKKESEFQNAAPLSNAAFRVTSNQLEVTRFTTDAQGQFRVALKPGHYSVVLTENRFPKPCGPFEIDVEAGKITDVEWHCDSGMR
jgi:Prealbumin-like fold domain